MRASRASVQCCAVLYITCDIVSCKVYSAVCRVVSCPPVSLHLAKLFAYLPRPYPLAAFARFRSSNCVNHSGLLIVTSLLALTSFF